MGPSSPADSTNEALSVGNVGNLLPLAPPCVLITPPPSIMKGKWAAAGCLRRRPLPNPDFPLLRVWFFQRFQVHTGFCVEDQECLVIYQELDGKGGGESLPPVNLLVVNVIF